MPHLVTSAQGHPHVQSREAALLNAGIYGPGQYVFSIGRKLAATMTDSNTMLIQDGAAMANGFFWSVDDAFEEVLIENGTPGYKRTDLVVAHIERYPKEDIDLRVLKGEETTGEPVMPAHIEGDLNDGDTVVEQPLWSVTLDGINPGEPVAQFEVSPSITEFRDSQSQRKPISVAFERASGISIADLQVEASGPWAYVRLSFRPTATMTAGSNRVIGTMGIAGALDGGFSLAGASGSAYVWSDGKVSFTSSIAVAANGPVFLAGMAHLN